MLGKLLYNVFPPNPGIQEFQRYHLFSLRLSLSLVRDGCVDKQLWSLPMGGCSLLWVKSHKFKPCLPTRASNRSWLCHSLEKGTKPSEWHASLNHTSFTGPDVPPFSSPADLFHSSVLSDRFFSLPELVCSLFVTRQRLYHYLRQLIFHPFYDIFPNFFEKVILLFSFIVIGTCRLHYDFLCCCLSFDQTSKSLPRR